MTDSKPTNIIGPDIINVTLRFKDDDYSTNYNNNRDNEIRFEELVNLLSKQVVTCYFQRLKEFEQTNKITGKISKQSTHKIFIDIGNETALEGTLSLFKDDYSYRIVKLKQIDFR